MFDVIANRGGTFENGTKYFLDGNWDLVIAHPPCTFLAVSGARWYYHPDDKNLPMDREDHIRNSLIEPKTVKRQSGSSWMFQGLE